MIDDYTVPIKLIKASGLSTNKRKNLAADLGVTFTLYWVSNDFGGFIIVIWVTRSLKAILRVESGEKSGV